jgi:hypothetical protein
MTNNLRISRAVTSYLDDNNTNPRQAARDINDQIGIPNAISYNTIRNWSKGCVSNPYSASPILLLLRERGAPELMALAETLIDILEIRQPVQD